MKLKDDKLVRTARLNSIHWSRKFNHLWMTCWFGLYLVSSHLPWTRLVVHILMMDEETYLFYSYIFLSICVLFWITIFFCCLGPFVVWYTGEVEDGPVTLRESLRRPPYGQRWAPPVESDFLSVLRRHNQSTNGRKRIQL